MEKEKAKNQIAKSNFSHTTVSDRNKSNIVYNPILLVEKISPLGIKWYMHRDDPFILGTLLECKDHSKHTPTAIVREIGKRYGRTCYKETVEKILFIWKKKGFIKHENVNGYDFFWVEKNSPC